MVSTISDFREMMMNKLNNFPILLSSTLLIVTQSNQLHADSYNERSCDCAEIIGKCSGAITDIREEKVAIQQTRSILFNVRSNHSQCSKVEYYIDNTPHQSVFFGGSTSESVFGLKKDLKKTQIEYSACHICKINGDKKKKISDEDIDALMDKAQKEGDQRINQVNYNARIAIKRSNDTYQSANNSMSSLRNSMEQTSQAITQNQRNSGRQNSQQQNNQHPIGNGCYGDPYCCKCLR